MIDGALRLRRGALQKLRRGLAAETDLRKARLPNEADNKEERDDGSRHDAVKK